MSMTRVRHVCVECGEPVPTAAHVVAPRSASLTAIRLSRCDACGLIADKYVEYDTLLITLDMLLHRASVYRHLLCNTQHTARRKTLLLYSLALLLCEPPLSWLSSAEHTPSALSPVQGPLHQSGAATAMAAQLLLRFGATLLGFVAFCAAALLAGRALVSQQQRPLCHLRAIATSVLLSSVGKSFALLPAIWDYGSMRFVFAQATTLFVLACNGVALRVQLRCDARTSVLIVGIAVAVRAALEFFLEWSISASLPTLLGPVWNGSLNVDDCKRTHVACGPCALLGAVE